MLNELLQRIPTVEVAKEFYISNFIEGIMKELITNQYYALWKDEYDVPVEVVDAVVDHMKKCGYIVKVKEELDMTFTSCDYLISLY